MDEKIQTLEPNYRRIYTDIINRKFPEKIDVCKNILQKHHLSALDVLELNKRIFGITNKETETQNQKHRSYDESSIQQIVDYQIKNKLNNCQLAIHFKLSRNTVAKWRKMAYMESENFS